MENLAPVPNVEQVQLQRFESNREPSLLRQQLASHKPQVMSDVDKGLEQGAHQWYWNEPVRQQFIKELGEQEGDMRFNELMKFVAATSSAAPVDNNIRKASYYRSQHLNGKLPYDLEGHPDAVKFQQATPPPEGYGSIAQANDLHWVLKYLRGQEHDDLLRSGQAHKIPSFGENLRGNLMPWTGDRHEAYTFGVQPRRSRKGEWEKQPLPPSAYPHAERLSQKWAREYGLMPAEFQAARWMGGGPRTGVESSDPSFAHTLETVVRKRAKELGLPEHIVLRNFIRNGTPLAVGDAAMAAAGQGEDQ